MFQNCKSLTSINFGNNFHTNNVINMVNLFTNCYSLQSMDYPIYVKYIYLNSFFENCYSLTSVNLQNFDTSSVNSFNNMFYNCYKLTSIDISKFYFKAYTNMVNMTRGCYSLTSLNFPNLEPTWVYFDGIFYDCPNLKYVNFSFVSNTYTQYRLFNGNISEKGTLILKKSFYNSQKEDFKEHIPTNWNLTLVD